MWCAKKPRQCLRDCSTMLSKGKETKRKWGTLLQGSGSVLKKKKKRRWLDRQEGPSSRVSRASGTEKKGRRREELTAPQREIGGKEKWKKSTFAKKLLFGC